MLGWESMKQERVLWIEKIYINSPVLGSAFTLNQNIIVKSERWFSLLCDEMGRSAV